MNMLRQGGVPQAVSLANFSAPSVSISSTIGGNIFQSLAQMQQPTQSVANILTSPPNVQLPRNALHHAQQQQAPQQQQQQHLHQQTSQFGFARRASGNLIRAQAPQLRLHQQGGDVATAAASGGGLIQIHPNQSTAGGHNIIQIHQGQILKSANASATGLIQTGQEVGALQSRTISPGAATATLISNASNPAPAINVANLQQIQIQPGTGNLNLNAIQTPGTSMGNINLASLPTHLQMQIAGSGGGGSITVPVSLAAALTQSVAANSAASGVGVQQAPASAAPASIALGLGTLSQSQSLNTPVMASGTKFLTTGASGQVFVASNSVGQTTNNLTTGAASNIQLQQSPHQTPQQQQQLVMAANGQFLQLNAATSAAAGLQRTQVRGGQIPLLQTVGVQQQQQQQQATQNILVANSQNVALQQQQSLQHSVDQRGTPTTNIQIQNPTSGVHRFRII